jgi:hypothetical protein
LLSVPALFLERASRGGADEGVEPSGGIVTEISKVAALERTQKRQDERPGRPRRANDGESNGVRIRPAVNCLALGAQGFEGRLRFQSGRDIRVSEAGVLQGGAPNPGVGITEQALTDASGTGSRQRDAITHTE